MSILLNGKTKNPLIIGLTGAPGSGKDHFYKTLRNLISATKHTQRIAFGDQLKQDILDLTGDWTSIGKEAIRPLMQIYGETMRKLHGDDYWINESELVHRHIYHVAVYTDVRYENEAQYIRDQGGYIIRVVQKSPCDVHHDNPIEHNWKEIEPYATVVLNKDDDDATEAAILGIYKTLLSKHTS